VTTSAEIVALFGRRSSGAPNIADKDSPTSVALAELVFQALGVDRISTEKGQTLGSRFEGAVRAFLEAELPPLAPHQAFEIESRRIFEFAQYAHLARITELLEERDPSGTLRAEMGTDYLIKPDVTVALLGSDPPFLHAAVSCKWTIRSDRVQNIRHEGVILTRHRRGRQPHVVTVTSEPLPSRLAAIARGTGEVDCVYHAALGPLHEAVATVGNASELDVLEELIEQDRLRPLEVLPEVLAYY
jgi:hypothetical protein